MLWQDWVFSIGSIIFTIALIPSIRSKDKPNLSTSLITTLTLLVYALTFSTLSLWFSAFSTALNAICWSILAFQKYSQKS